jgi:hypothetical protein
MEPTTSVNVGSCRCAGEPHPDGDTVELRPKLGLAEGVRLQAAVVDAKQRGLDAPAVTGLLAESYLLVGVTGWNLVDEQGKALPVTPETIQSELLSDFTRAAPVSGGRHRFFSEAGCQLIALHHDKRVDISDGWWIAQSPEALEAILDYHYPDGRHRSDYGVARWRLQVLADKQVGVRWRQELAKQDDAVGRLKRSVLSGNR